jgi:hypothetical protein
MAKGRTILIRFHLRTVNVNVISPCIVHHTHNIPILPGPTTKQLSWRHVSIGPITKYRVPYIPRITWIPLNSPEWYGRSLCCHLCNKYVHIQRDENGGSDSVFGKMIVTDIVPIQAAHSCNNTYDIILCHNPVIRISVWLQFLCLVTRNTFLASWLKQLHSARPVLRS